MPHFSRAGCTDSRHNFSLQSCLSQVELDLDKGELTHELFSLLPSSNCLARMFLGFFPHCTSPADMYFLLKSSDFISYDLDPPLAFEGGMPCSHELTLSSADKQALCRHELKLELKKWYLIDHGHEF